MKDPRPLAEAYLAFPWRGAATSHRYRCGYPLAVARHCDSWRPRNFHLFRTFRKTLVTKATLTKALDRLVRKDLIQGTS